MHPRNYPQVYHGAEENHLGPLTLLKRSPRYLVIVIVIGKAPNTDAQPHRPQERALTRKPRFLRVNKMERLVITDVESMSPWISKCLHGTPFARIWSIASSHHNASEYSPNLNLADHSPSPRFVVNLNCFVRWASNIFTSSIRPLLAAVSTASLLDLVLIFTSAPFSSRISTMT